MESLCPSSFYHSITAPNLSYIVNISDEPGISHIHPNSEDLEYFDREHIKLVNFYQVFYCLEKYGK